MQAAVTAGSPANPPDAGRIDLAERAGRVAALGYRPAEAEFLVAAALLGGFFVRRQFREFRKSGGGGSEAGLLRRARANGHLKADGRKPRLYRLCGAPLFRAAGCKVPGSVPGRAPRAAKQRLLALDYWIACRETARLLLAAEDKADYFAALGIGRDRFPAAVRARQGRRAAFPDGFPIGVPGAGCPAVRFTYAHAGSSAHGMERHLRSHEPLARALHLRGMPCQWVVLADSRAQFARLRHAWNRWLARAGRDWSEGEYFELRRRVDQRRWQELSRESVERYARLAAEHGSAAAEGRYQAWARGGAPERQPGGDFAASCSLLEVLMEFDYAAAEAASR